MSTKPMAAQISIWRKLLLSIALITVGLCALTLSFSPSVQATAPPTSLQVNQARSFFSQIKAASHEEKPVRVQIRWDELESAVVLGGHAVGLRNINTRHSADQIAFDGSKRLPLGLWINFSAYVRPTPNGFPILTARIGRIPLPGFATRLTINIARKLLKWRGFDAPKPEALLSDLQLTPQNFNARVDIPRDSKFYAALNSTRGQAVDLDRVAAIYCALTERQRNAPSDALAQQIRRAFDSESPGFGSAQTNRAALVALSMLVVAPEAGRIAGEIAPRIKSCRMDAPEIKLLGRADLAKHWALSAAMTGTFGSALSQAMGTWKEVSDSGPAGSGFSFVDLAADRSGIYFGQRATRENEAMAVAHELSRATEEDILPMQALSLIEGIDERQFNQRFEDTDSASYARMIEKIDTVLSKAR